MTMIGYIFDLVIGVTIFFILRWALKKFITTYRLRIVLSLIGTIILIPIINVGLLLIYLSIHYYEPHRDFEKERWFADKAKRYEMLDDLEENEILKNRNKTEIVDILGLPDFGTDTTNTWNYDLGTSGAVWQFNSLILIFDNDKVVNVEKKIMVD